MTDTLALARAVNPYTALLDAYRPALCVPDRYSAEWSALVRLVERVTHRIEACRLARESLADDAKAQVVKQLGAERDDLQGDIDHHQRLLVMLNETYAITRSANAKEGIARTEGQLRALRRDSSPAALNARYLAVIDQRSKALEVSERRLNEALDEMEAWVDQHRA